MKVSEATIVRKDDRGMLQSMSMTISAHEMLH
jgi:hypothetical protein